MKPVISLEMYFPHSKKWARLFIPPGRGDLRVYGQELKNAHPKTQYRLVDETGGVPVIHEFEKEKK